MRIPYVADFVGKNIPAGMVYVGCSRASSLDLLCVRNLNPADIKAHPSAVKEMQRLHQECQLDINAPNYNFLRAQQICYLNVSRIQSIASASHKLTHEAEVHASPHLINSRVLILAETGGTITTELLPHYQKRELASGRGMLAFIHPTSEILDFYAINFEGIDMMQFTLSQPNAASLQITTFKINQFNSLSWDLCTDPSDYLHVLS